MIKVSFFSSEGAGGPRVVPLFSPGERLLEKTGSPILMPAVTRYIESLRPRQDAQYVLLNAMGAGEYWGSNVNGDYFPEEALVHAPDDWTGNPLVDSIKAKAWPYGYPTFYGAKPFLHHRNKDFPPHNHPSFGEVELSVWNPRMKRVELVARIDRKLCESSGGMGLWDKLRAGNLPDVSMGCKVPFDTCFPAGTLVRTTAGHKPIEEICAGEKVLTHTGTTRVVTTTMRRTAEGLTVIRAAGLPEIRSTDNHPFLVLRKEQARTCKGTVNGQRCRHSFDGAPTCRRCGKKPDFDLVWAAAENVRPGDYLATPVTCGSAEVSRARARALGYYLGDGYVIKQRTGKQKDGDYRDMGVGFSVGHAEKKHLEKLLSTLSDVSEGEARVYEAGCDRKAFIVSLYDQELAAWVQQMGGKGARGKRLDEEVFGWTAAAKIQLVAGYIDTDGSFDAASGQVRIASVNRGLLLDMQRVLLSLGCHASVCFAGSGGGYEGSSECWYLYLSAFQAQGFLDVSTEIEKREIGWDSPQSFFWGKHWLTPVKSVEEADGEVEVYNLSVEGDESYVAEGRAVHNCSICLDWNKYRKAQATFDKEKHKHPGEAVLEWHKKNPIRGLSITRKDYCEHAKNQMNKILPDGRKVFVYNDYPRFFDISFVFIGADKTAKAMMKIADGARVFWSLPSAEIAEKLGYVEGEEKTASVETDALKLAFLGKRAKDKRGEITKDVVPSQFAGKAVPVLTKNESDLPRELLNLLGKQPLGKALSTTTGLGMVLRPREFQRVVLIGMKMPMTADVLEERGIVFPRVEEESPAGLEESSFCAALARLLLPFLAARSAFGPAIERRVVVLAGDRGEAKKASSSLSSDLLHKIGAAYNGYRNGVMELVASAQGLLASAATSQEVALQKLAIAPAEEIFTPLSFEYLNKAFRDEMSEVGVTAQARAGVERGFPSRNT